jgi:hypothetical protein
LQFSLFLARYIHQISKVSGCFRVPLLSTTLSFLKNLSSLTTATIHILASPPSPRRPEDDSITRLLCLRHLAFASQRSRCRCGCQKEWVSEMEGSQREELMGEGIREWIPPCAKAKEKRLPPGHGGKLAAASRSERFRVCSCSGSFCLSQELAEQRVVELVSSPASANDQSFFSESAEMCVLESWNEMARVDFVLLRSS